MGNAGSGKVEAEGIGTLQHDCQVASKLEDRSRLVSHAIGMRSSASRSIIHSEMWPERSIFSATPLFGDYDVVLFGEPLEFAYYRLLAPRQEMEANSEGPTTLGSPRRESTHSRPSNALLSAPNFGRSLR